MRFLLLVCFLVFFAACNIQQTPLTREEVVEVINRFDQAWMKKALKSVDSVLAPSYIYFTQSGGIFSRANLVQTAGAPEYTLDDMDRNVLHVQLYGNTAVVSTRWRGKGKYMGVPFDEDQRCSITIVKMAGKVQILTEHCTPIRADRAFH